MKCVKSGKLTDLFCFITRKLCNFGKFDVITIEFESYKHEIVKFNNFEIVKCQKRNIDNLG